MDPKRFFVNDCPSRHHSKSKRFKKDLFFKYDDNPGYCKDGYYFDVKSIFSAWEEKGQIIEQPQEKEKNIKKIDKDNSLFDEEITLRNKFIKKISFVPNFRLEDTKNFFQKQKNLKKKEEEGETDEDEKKNEEESNNNMIEEDLDDIKYGYNHKYSTSNYSLKPFERFFDEIKVSKEELKEYNLKIEKAKKEKRDIFQLIKEIKTNNKNIIEEKKEIKKMKKIKDIENNEIQFLTPQEQNELLMFFIPDEVNSTKDTICESCQGKGHSKEQCMDFPDPDYDSSLKFCMNCGNSGHLYCRNGVNDEENNLYDISEEDDDEIIIYNHGKRYYFDFKLDEDKERNISDNQDEEELYETGATNLINEDSKEDNMINYLF